MELEFFQIENRLSEHSEILNTIRNWDYIPSAMLISSVFNIPYQSAFAVRKKIFKEKFRDLPECFRYVYFKQKYSAFKRLHREIELFRKLSTLRVWRDITK